MSLDEALEALDSMESKVGGTTEDALAQTIKSELAESSKKDYRPYNRSNDFLGPIDRQNHISDD